MDIITVFGTVVPGSSPGGSTKGKVSVICVCFVDKANPSRVQY